MKFFYTKITESDFLMKNPNLTKNEKRILAVGRGGGGGVARVSDLFVFFQKNSSLKKKCFPFDRVKVKEDWLE